MPDDAAHADDISDLWGADQQGALEPVRPSPRATDGNGNRAHPAAGSGNGGAASHEELARLVEAVAARQIRAASRAELDAVSERITAVQDDVRALHDAVAELRKAVDRQGRRSRGRAWLGRPE
jgi:cytochrome c556